MKIIRKEYPRVCYRYELDLANEKLRAYISECLNENKEGIKFEVTPEFMNDWATNWYRDSEFKDEIFDVKYTFGTDEYPIKITIGDRISDIINDELWECERVIDPSYEDWYCDCDYDDELED